MNSKLITIVTIAALLFSCSATKITKTDVAIINTYFESVVYSEDYAIISVCEESLPVKEAVAVYEIAYRERTFGSKDLTEVFVFPKMQNWPLDEKEITALKNKVQEATPSVWKADDFNDSRIIVMKKRKILSELRFNPEYLSGKNAIIYVSKPIYSSNKQYVLFECVISRYFGNGPTEGSGIVLMKNVDGKWEQVALFNREVYY